MCPAVPRNRGATSLGCGVLIISTPASSRLAPAFSWWHTLCQTQVCKLATFQGMAKRTTLDVSKCERPINAPQPMVDMEFTASALATCRAQVCMFVTLPNPGKELRSETVLDFPRPPSQPQAFDMVSSAPPKT